MPLDEELLFTFGPWDCPPLLTTHLNVAVRHKYELTRQNCLNLPIANFRAKATFYLMALNREEFVVTILILDHIREEKN